MSRRRRYGGGYRWGRDRYHSYDDSGHYHRGGSTIGTVLGCAAALFFVVLALLAVLLMFVLTA